MEILRPLRQWFRRRDKDALRGLASTSLWQIANYIIPLLVFPYLARVLGVHGFGIIALASAAIGYALLLTDWGFSLSASQAVARARDDPPTVNRIVWATILAKLLLGGVSSALTIACTWLLVADPVLQMVMLVSMLNVVASIFNLDWALRGVEAMSEFATSSIVGRLSSVPLVYLLVHRDTQIAEAAFCTAAGGLVTAAITVQMARRLGLFGRPDVNLAAAYRQIKSGAHLFLSTAAISIYTNCLALALGLAAGTRQVGLFSGAERIRRPVQGLMAPIGMVFYPRVSYQAASDPERAWRTCGALLKYMGGFSLILSLALLATAPLLVRLLLGPGFDEAVVVLQIMAPTIFLIGISNVLGLMVMLPFGLKREFTLCTLLGAGVGLCAVVPLAYYHGACGAAFAGILAETAVTLSMFTLLWRKFAGRRRDGNGI